MDAMFVRSQGLTSDRQRLRVYIETEELSIWRTRLQNAASVPARAESPIHVAPTAPRLQRVYNLFVKYRLMRCVHLCGDNPCGYPNMGDYKSRPYELFFERSSVAKRWTLASTSCNLSICFFHSAGVHTSK